MWLRLEADKPAVALLEGPQGVGKFLGATQVAARLTVPDNIVGYQNMSAQDARAVGEWLSWRSDAPKVAVLEPGNCHQSVWTILKCLLEDVPKGHHVWVVSSSQHRAPESIQGLAYRYRFSLLSSAEMAQCFKDAGTLAQDPEYLMSLGSVDRALSMNRSLNVKPAVASWIEAVEQSNRGLLMTAAKTWEQRHTDLLIAEIEKQLGKKSLVEGAKFSRVERQRLLRAITFLTDCPNPFIGAVTAGLSLMPGR